MGLEFRQQLKLSQQLVMTPQLQQAIKLLQLSRLELVETVRQELLENPFLEEKDTHEVSEPTIAEEQRPINQEDAELLRNADWENYLGEFSSIPKQVQVREYEASEEGPSFEARVSSRPSLEGHLNWQMHLSSFPSTDFEIGDAVVGNLDERGYLQATAGEIAAQVNSTAEVKVTEAQVEAVIRRIQYLDPVGVASRTPQECLLVQLAVSGMDKDPILVSLVSEHLEDLEKRRYKPLVRKFKISLEELKEYIDIIQTLDPMPGSSFSGVEPHYISPDVFVYKYGDDFIIVLNEDGIPPLQLNALYMENFKAKTSEEKNYFQDKMRSAAWLMKSLYQRQHTLYKVVESIVRFQRAFFEHGVTHLKPLILKEVAEDIRMHESTVSRITTNKYVSTPHGIFELKFFFNSALDLDDGTQMGSESVKALIKQYIAGEDPRHPLSDEAIGDLLKEKLDVNIARRTVAKYRSAMGIDSSSKRKQFF